MRTPANPFLVSGYHSPAYFCDREEELMWLTDQIDNERNVVLYSWRRTGKTALVKHFFHYLEKKNRMTGVFVDLLGTASLSEANKRISQAIIQRFSSSTKAFGSRLMKLVGSLGATVGVDPVTGMPEVTVGMVKENTVSHSLEALGQFMSEQKRTIVVCIDEFQQIVNFPEKDSEAIFRNWTQSFPMVRFIFSGSHRHMMISMFSERSRPFYQSAQLRQLNPLNADVYSAFITERFEAAGKNFDPQLILKVFQWARMQTYCVQLVCNKLFGKTDQVDEDILKEVFLEIIRQEIPVFSYYQQLFTAFQWKFLIAVAREERVANPLAKGFINKHGLGAASSVSSALKTLIKKEFIIEDDGAYALHDTLLMRWLQQL